jgi:hypothetical protein
MKVMKSVNQDSIFGPRKNGLVLLAGIVADINMVNTVGTAINQQTLNFILHIIFLNNMI